MIITWFLLGLLENKGFISKLKFCDKSCASHLDISKL